jgi:Coenzyme PQQ synthesis protein D (PqqD)
MAGVVSGCSTVVAAEGQISCDLAGEAAILSLTSGVYYSLDPVGARVWNLIQRPRTVHDIRDMLLQEYDVEAERCERDLLALLRELAAEGLIEVRDETAAQVSAAHRG